MDEETKAFARPELENMLAMLGEAEVEMLAAMVEQPPDNPPEDDVGEAPAEAATPEDLDTISTAARSKRQSSIPAANIAGSAKRSWPKRQRRRKISS